jgi:hypothetical protein
MLEVGNGGMTEAEYRSHFSIWALAKVLIFPYAFNIVASVLNFPAFSHCNTGSSCVGPTSDRVRCALDEPGDKKHNQ